MATIIDVGYGAAPTDRDDPAESARRLADLRRRLWLASALGLPVLALSMMPGLQFDGWQWVALGAIIVVNVVYFQQGILGWAAEKWPEKFGITVERGGDSSAGDAETPAREAAS